MPIAHALDGRFLAHRPRSTLHIYSERRAPRRLAIGVGVGLGLRVGAGVGLRVGVGLTGDVGADPSYAYAPMSQAPGGAVLALPSLSVVKIW